MRIGITGGFGFIGTALGQEAKRRGHEIVVFSRKAQPPPPWAVETRVLELENEKAPVLDPSGLDALVHLAGESVMGLWTADKKKRIRESRVPVTRRVVQALKSCTNGPKLLFCASGTGAYGHRGDELLTENSIRGEGFLAEVCAAWEAAAWEVTAIPGARVVMLRTGMVLGKEGGGWPLLKKVFKLRLGSRLGDGRQWVPWIHLDDEVGIILHAIETPACHGPINLSSPNPVTNAEMTRLIAGVLGASTFVPVPAFAMKLVLGDFAAAVLDSERVIPQVALDTGYRFQHPEFREAVASLV